MPDVRLHSYAGIGGDAFALFWDVEVGKMRCLMGNGRSPGGLTMDAVRARGIKGSALPPFHAVTVTVPGAAAAWEDAVKQWGSLPLSQVRLQHSEKFSSQGKERSCNVRSVVKQLSCSRLRMCIRQAFLGPSACEGWHTGIQGCAIFKRGVQLNAGPAAGDRAGRGRLPGQPGDSAPVAGLLRPAHQGRRPRGAT